jgi:ATP-dependent exoDNAse (exonuclease V) beta subunit
VRQDGTSPWVTLERLRAGDIAVPQTGHILARFDAIKAQLSELQAAADVDEFIELWLPPDPSTELLAEAVAEARQEAATVPELYSALYARITEPELPLEVKEVRVMSLHKSKGLSLARDGL